MTLEILTPTKQQMLTINWLEVNTGIGNLVIQPGHAPTVMTLADQTTAIAALPSGGEEIIPVTSGVIEVTRTGIRLLLK